jgi:hypothetical protein
MSQRVFNFVGGEENFEMCALLDGKPVEGLEN